MPFEPFSTIYLTIATIWALAFGTIWVIDVLDPFLDEDRRIAFARLFAAAHIWPLAALYAGIKGRRLLKTIVVVFWNDLLGKRED